MPYSCGVLKYRFVCMCVCIACLSVYHVFTAHEGQKRGEILQNWSYRWLGVIKQVLGTKARSSAKVLLLSHLSVPILVLISL